MDIVENALNQNSYDNSIDPNLFTARVLVCGVGGGGSNTVNRISKMEVKGATLVAVNTDKKHLSSLDPSIKKILIGGDLTRGLGAGGFPEIGAKAAEYSRIELADAVKEANLVFLTAGMGGGTGGGAAPVVARLAKDNGAIVIAIVTSPFALERIRIKVANDSIRELEKNCDTLIVIDNQKLVNLYPNLVIDQAFKIADEIASHAVVGITETIVAPSLINLDFADVKAVMSNGGLAMISVGEGKGVNKVEEVVANTLRNKLLDVDYENAKSVLVHITGGPDLTLGDANLIGTKITEMAAPNANVLWGARIDPAYEDKVEVIAIFTGVKSPSISGVGGKEETDYEGDIPLI